MNSPRKTTPQASHITGTIGFIIVCSVLFLLLSGLCRPARSATPEPPQKPPAYVVDLAGVITEEGKARLNAYLKELEQKTTAQVVVLTIRSLDGEDIAGFSLRTAERWKLGRKGKDNGVLITIVVKDRKYRFEIGYGLESILPDSLVGSLGREYLVPNFRKGDYSTGIIDATAVIIKTIASHEGVEIAGVPQIQVKHGKKPSTVGFGWIILGIILLGGLIILLARHPELALLLFLPTPGRRGRDRWTGGGGFGGGGFGSFGGGGGSDLGGGGGDFGGGGASGDW